MRTAQGCSWARRAPGQAPQALWVSSNRKVWQDLGQAHTPLADLVLSTISAIEDQSQDDLVSGVRSLCQVTYPQLQPLQGPLLLPVVWPEGASVSRALSSPGQ